MFDLQDFVAEHQRALFNFACQLTRSEDEADDLLQDTWIKCMLHQQLLSSLTTAKQRSWLFTVLKHRWLDICRHRKLERKVQAELDKPVTNPVQVYNLEPHLEQLSPLEQQILRMKFWEEKNSREIAAELKLPEGTVRWRLKQALDQLRRLIEKSDKEARCLP
ncbi:MAG: RNA polymerase sigma factor [Candidatus Cloacimonetes bacterium]|nr:RNA polymerase sigma factor [Candidatus Cloacimonadota bacterium]